MKKTSLLLVLAFWATSAFATDYYFSVNGSDKNKGTSADKPYQSLGMIKDLDLKPGDRILLKKGETFRGTIELSGVAGRKENPIRITSYGSGKKNPVIDAKGELNGILIEDCSYINASGLEITANGGGLENYDASQRYMRCGVFITTKKDGDYRGISLANLHVRDVFFEEEGFNRGSAEVLTANGIQNYGWGIRVINHHSKALLSDILVRDCLVENVGHSGIRFTGKSLNGSKHKNISNIKILNNRVIRVGGPGLQASSAEDVVFSNNDVNFSGSPDDSRKWGRGSGLWVWGCLNALIEGNSFRNANGPGDSAGCHIDFNNKNVIIQYNLSENNVGGFVEILGNNHNCTYRYNVSINDGARKMIKGKTLGAGTSIGVNGWVGRNRPRLGPFNIYIYNNTIYVNDSFAPEVGVSEHTRGILIANNIFYLEGGVEHDPRKPFLPENGPVPNVVFKNNLYLNAHCWPADSLVMMTDEAPLYGDPKFYNKGGQDIKDYIPQNSALIKDKGIEIDFIPTDTIGLMGGFKLETDILGNKILGQPDMGAIEMKDAYLQ